MILTLISIVLVLIGLVAIGLIWAIAEGSSGSSIDGCLPLFILSCVVVACGIGLHFCGTLLIVLELLL